MNPILLSVLIVSAIGLLAGLGLAVASIVMAVPVDEKAEALEPCCLVQTAARAGSPAARATQRHSLREKPGRPRSARPGATRRQRKSRRFSASPPGM